MPNPLLDVDELAGLLVLGALLARLRDAGGYELLAHWQQGEFHHDVVLQVKGALPGEFLVVATNCNGGIKEVLCLAAMPDRGGLWLSRCPSNPEFSGSEPAVVARSRTTHWFDPCELLGAEARSELRQEHRVRQPGGGWQQRD